MKKIGMCLCVLIVFSLNQGMATDMAKEVLINHQEMMETISKNELLLHATNAILYDKTYQTVLYEKEARERVPNASTTKILTAIVAYENANVNDVVVVSRNAANMGGSVIHLRSGDHVSLDGLIKGLLVHSGNDAAIAIAEYVGGDVETFSEMLNDKAKELGLCNTHFVTPHGLDEPEHYSSAYDLAIMAGYLLDTPYLASIVREKVVNIQVENQTRILTTTNEMLSLYDGTNGVKTGYTEDAGRCLVTSCTRNHRTLISVVLGCGTKKQRTDDSIQLLNYGFREFEIVNICNNMEKEFALFVDKGMNHTYLLKVYEEIDYPIKRNNLDKIVYHYQIKQHFSAPVIKGEKIGQIEIYLDQNLLYTLEIKMPITIEKKGILTYLKELLEKNEKF